MQTFDADTWGADWAWSLPLISINVALHVLVLVFVTERVDGVLKVLGGRRRFTSRFALVMSGMVAVATLLHGVEAYSWAIAYRLLGVLPNTKLAMLYSLSAMTTFGNANTTLPDRWLLLGALEALDGMILFGLTTAFLFAVIQRIRPLGG
jgi:hypothetical protein